MTKVEVAPHEEPAMTPRVAAQRIAGRTRAEQGLPPTVADPIAIERLATLVDVDDPKRVAA